MHFHLRREQQDAHEFYSGCIDAVATDVGRAIKALSAAAASNDKTARLQLQEPGAPVAPATGAAAADGLADGGLVDGGGGEGGGQGDEDMVEGELASAVRDLKRANVCNLNMNLQVSHTLLCENTACRSEREVE